MQQAPSSGYDGDPVVGPGEREGDQHYPAPLKYVHLAAILPDGGRRHSWAAIGRWCCGECARCGKEARRFDGHTDAVISIAVSADGKRALSGSDDGTLARGTWRPGTP